MIRVRVCRKDEVPPGEMRAFAVAGLASKVLVARVGARYFATASVCPHEAVDLVDGELAGKKIVCPGHGYELDLEDGRCLPDRSLRLATYRVSLVGDDVWIDLVSG